MARYISESDIYKLFEESNGIIRLHVAQIDELPRADVEEVRHGEWIEVAENSTGKIMVCTKCKNCINPNKEDVTMNRASEKPSYCPNCGAKMDGGN